jgi:hypothetical protein
VPARGRNYAKELVDLSDFGLVDATAKEATLTVRVPADLEDELDSVGPIRVSEVQHARCER